jgi:hypothetical protein
VTTRPSGRSGDIGAWQVDAGDTRIVGFALFLLLALAVVWLNLQYGVRMAVEVGRYATSALADRSTSVQSVGWFVGLAMGWSLWPALMIFNWLAFKTPYPVTQRRLQPRRF